MYRSLSLSLMVFFLSHFHFFYKEQGMCMEMNRPMMLFHLVGTLGNSVFIIFACLMRCLAVVKLIYS